MLVNLLFLSNKNMLCLSCSVQSTKQTLTTVFSWFYVMPVTLWLKGVVGGFSSLFFPDRVAKSRPFLCPTLLPTFFLVQNEATPSALWRGVDGSSPMLLWEKECPALFLCHWHVSECISWFRESCFGEVIIFITTFFERDEAFVFERPVR